MKRQVEFGSGGKASFTACINSIDVGQFCVVVAPPPQNMMKYLFPDPAPETLHIILYIEHKHVEGQSLVSRSDWICKVDL